MSEIALQPIRDPAVWRADEIGGKAGLTRFFDRAEITAITELIDATGGPPLLDLRPEDFPHPVLAGLARACRHELARGRGAVILSGLDRDRLQLEEFRRSYWLLGQLIGRPVAQNEKGELIGYVRHEKTQALPRGYTSNVELGFHTDFHEILSLASVETAFEGGETGLASSAFIHNVMLEECPDLLRALYTGWYDGLEAFWFQKLRSRNDLSDELVPFFCAVEDKVSFQNSLFTYLSSEERGEEVPAMLTEAVAAVEEIARRPGVAARFILQPGEMLFWHNYTVMHARSEFRDAAGQERLLMRLWMHAHEKRPTSAAILDRAKAVDRILGELRS